MLVVDCLKILHQRHSWNEKGPGLDQDTVYNNPKTVKSQIEEEYTL